MNVIVKKWRMRFIGGGGAGGEEKQQQEAKKEQEEEAAVAQETYSGALECQGSESGSRVLRSKEDDDSWMA